VSASDTLATIVLIEDESIVHGDDCTASTIVTSRKNARKLPGGVHIIILSLVASTFDELLECLPQRRGEPSLLRLIGWRW